MSDQRPSQPDSFSDIFGVSKEELSAQGVDVNQYARDHVMEAARRRNPDMFLLGSWIDRAIWEIGILVGVSVLTAVASSSILRSHASAQSVFAGFWLLTALVVAFDLTRTWRPVKHVQDEVWRQQSMKPLLPYHSGDAWISRGRTMASRYWRGSLDIADGRLTLSCKYEGVLAQAPIQDIRIATAHGWFGMGVCLKFPRSGKWFVIPEYQTISTKTVRRGNKRFRAAFEASRSTLDSN